MQNDFRSGFIALLGRTNAGKSTLLNKLIGQKIAIVSDKPQTTRNKIVGVLSKPEYQIVFLDTPGIHKPRHQLGQMMVSTAFKTLEGVDLIYYLIDVSVPFGSGESFLIERLQKVATPIFLLLNKIDLLPKEELLPLIDFYRQQREWTEIVPLSALKGENVEPLLAVTLKYLPEGPKYYPEDVVTDQPEKIVAAEIIREKVLKLTHEEVPHSVAVVVEVLEERTATLIYVGATIFVERNSQKAILIGKQGQMLKQIGILARKELEEIWGVALYLDLWVKVSPAWREKEHYLRNFGYLPD